MNAEEIEKLKHTPRQSIEEGVGPKYHRTYSVVFRASEQIALQTMKLLQTDPNVFSPQLIATFEKIDGSKKRLEKNDHFQIHISGPWNGPVRVEEVHDTSFRLVTLQGHLEAGEITFSIHKEDERHYRFKIESLARSKDYIVDLLYDKIPIAKTAQREMWTIFCNAFAEKALELQNLDPKAEEGRISKVDVTTEKFE